MVLVPIVPDKPLFAIDEVRLAMLNALRSQGRAFRSKYNKITATWSTPADFKIKVSLKRTEPVGRVTTSTTDKRFVWADEGTPRHPITARNSKTLAFQSGYRRKTRPRQIRSFKGGKYGPLRTPVTVVHPGIQPGEFSETIAKKARQSGEWSERVQKAINKGITKYYSYKL